MKQIKKISALIVLMVAVSFSYAQESKTREVPNAPAFSAIEVIGGDINVYFTQGNTHSFSINGPAKLVKATKVKVKANTLFVEYQEPFFTGDDNDVSLYVTAPTLTRISVSGEADFESKTAFQGQELTIKTRQSGEVSMENVTVERLNIDAKGSSSVDVDYVEAKKVRISSLDRAEVEVTGNTAQVEIADKGMFAEIDTGKLLITKTPGENNTAGRVAKDGSVEFSFDD